MIRIICGTCGTTQGYKTAADGNLTLPADEERRLVARGVAEYVTRPIIGPDTGVATSAESENGGGAGIDPPHEDPPVEGLENGGSDTPAGGLPSLADILNGHFTRESLMQMRRLDMEKLAGDLGVDVSRCKNKNDIVALLSTVEVQADDDGEAPPELGAEAPVV